MSIQSEITRISGNISSSLTKVASKGVTVPSGSNSDDLPDLIDLIVVDPTYSISKTLTNVTSSADDTKVIAGNSFFTELTPSSGYVISSITVTMGGVDITDQVFKPGIGAKAITANGTYNAVSDNLSGYSNVVVSVPPNVGTKSITTNGTYTASSDSLDGYSSVTVNVPTGSTPTGTKSISITSNGTTTEDVTNFATASITANVPNTYTSSDEGKVVSNGSLVSQTSSSVTQNGTVDTTLINSLLVAVAGGSSVKTGTVTPASRTLSISFDTGLSSITGILIVPTSETPLKSGGRTLIAAIITPNNYYKSIHLCSNNSGASFLTPNASTTSTRYTASGTTVTVTTVSNQGGYFEAISYTWYAW